MYVGWCDERTVTVSELTFSRLPLLRTIHKLYEGHFKTSDQCVTDNSLQLLTFILLDLLDWHLGFS